MDIYKIFLGQKYARTLRQVQFVVCKKIYKCLLLQIAREITILLVNNVHEKTTEKVKADEILKACARYL